MAFSQQVSTARERRGVSPCVPYARGVCLFIAHFFLAVSLIRFCLSYWEAKEKNTGSDFRFEAKWDGPFKDATRHTANTPSLPKTIIAKQMYLYTHSVCFSSLHRISFFLFHVTPFVFILSARSCWPSRVFSCAGRRRLIFLFT